MSETVAAAASEKKGFSERMLDGVERLGNKVPNPVLMFLYLIGFIIVLSTVLDWANVSVTELIAEPVPVEVDPNYYEDTTGVVAEVDDYQEPQFEIREATIGVRGMLSVEGIRFIFTSFVSNFAGFSVVAVTFIAMMGAGVAEQAGLMGALIRLIVRKAPASLITFLIVLVGGLSSVASDAGYLILIPLAAVAFLAVGRHPLAGLAAGFAGVAATFAVNIIPQPTDAMLTEIANESIVLAGGEAMTILNGYYFGVVSLLVMCLVATFITDRMIEPRLGKFDTSLLDPADAQEDEIDPAVEARGLRFAGIGTLVMVLIVALCTVPSGAPLREPETGDILGNTPFMTSLIFIIALLFLVAGVCFGVGIGRITKADDVIGYIAKTFGTLGGLVLMFLMIAQFIAYFNWTNLPPVIAIAMADVLERADLSAIPLLVGFIIVILLLDFILPGAVPKWAIFAPVFIPIFIRLDVAPQSLMNAYRIGDSPVNTLTPLMVYFPFIVTVAQRYRKDAGIGTIVSMMIPYAALMGLVWVILFVIWFALGIPLGPGYPVKF